MANPIVIITMDNGDMMKTELYPQIASNVVNNFTNPINKGSYDGKIFHRVISGFMIQDGCPNESGMGDPGYSIKEEFSRDGSKSDLKCTAGIPSMAKSMMPDSAGSQFFIMRVTSPHLDGAYAGLGGVTEGMDVVSKTMDVQTGYNDRPMREQKTKSMTVETSRGAYPEPETM